MNSTTLERPDVAAYLAAVRTSLADLPAEERDDLLADVAASLVDAGEAPGLPPDEFAAELREAAGLTAPRAGDSGRALSALRSWLASDRAASLRRTAVELAPIWWLGRAYVAAAAVALAAGWGWPLGSGRSDTFWIETSVLALAAAVALSLWLGLRGRRDGVARPRVAVAVNLALAVLAVPVLAHSLDRIAYARATEPYPYTYVEPTPGLARDGVQLTNLYAYTRDGEPLYDVLLYDAEGLPVEIFPGTEDPLRRVLVAADGSRLFNSYPIRYFEPGTATVAQPDLGPQVTVPEILTPELDAG